MNLEARKVWMTAARKINVPTRLNGSARTRWTSFSWILVICLSWYSSKDLGKSAVTRPGPGDEASPDWIRQSDRRNSVKSTAGTGREAEREVRGEKWEGQQRRGVHRDLGGDGSLGQVG